MNSEKLPTHTKDVDAEAKKVEGISEELRKKQVMELLGAGDTTVEQIKEALGKQELTIDELMEFFMGNDNNKTLR